MYMPIVTVIEGFPNCVLKLDLEVLLLQSKQKIINQCSQLEYTL